MSVIVAMLLMSLVFLTFFTYNVSFRLNKTVDSKKVLANNISSAFIKEIDTMYHKIAAYDSFLNRHKLLDRDIILLDSMPMFYDKQLIADSLADTLTGITKNSSIKHLFWLDKNGNEIRNWSTKNFIAPHGNFITRPYFRRIVDNDPYYLTGVSPASFDTSKKFFLEPVVSWTSGGFTTVLSIPSKDKSGIAAVSFKMRSLEDVLLPMGYMLAMIDENGRVLYHSESARNLNENLKDEFKGEGKRMLISAMQSHTESVFSTEYFSREYNIQIKPLPYLPYNIVVFGDVSQRETRDMEIFSFSFIMLLLFFLLLTLELFTIFFVSAKRSFFKRQLFNTGWIGPRVSCKNEYLLSTIMNGIVIILLIVFFSITSFLTYLFILLFSATLTSLFWIGLFAKRYKAEKRNARRYKVDAARSLIIIIILIDIIACIVLCSVEQIATLLGYELIAFIIGYLIYIKSDIIVKKSYALQQSRVAKKWEKMLIPVFWRWDHINSFSLAALTRLIITSGIPVVFFYTSSYNYEQNIGIRYRQTKYAEKLEKRLDTNYTLPRFDGDKGIYADSTWIRNVELVSRNEIRPEEYKKHEERSLDLLGNFRIYITNEATAGKNFYKKASDDSLFRYNHLFRNVDWKDPGTITYMQTALPGKYLKISSTDMNYNFPPFFKRFLFWLLLLIFLFGLYFILYFVIRKLFALKIPDLSLWKDLDEKLVADNKLNHLLFVIGLPGAEKKTKIIEKVKTGEILSIDGEKLIYNEKESDAWEKNNVIIVDLIRIPESENEEEKKAWKEYAAKVLDGNFKLVIVNHFEYNIQDAHTNQYKLNFLEGLMQKVRGKIIILSTIHPVAFLDSMFSNSLKEKAKEAGPDRSIPGQDLERWHVLLGHYRIAMFPLEPIPYRDKTIALPQQIVKMRMKRPANEKMISFYWENISEPNGSRATITTPHDPDTEVTGLLIPGEYKFKLTITFDDSENKPGGSRQEIEDFTVVVKSSDSEEFPLTKAIRNETLQTHFLNKMRTVTAEAGYVAINELRDRNEKVNADEMVFKLQVTAHYFYMYVWQSLTKEEKFLLYDLAEDDLVNSFDDYNLSMLIAKGVIIRQDGTLRIFNKGFRNFILTAIGNTEMMKIKEQMSEKGNWGKLKAPLMIIVIAILAFLLASQEETYSRLFTYVGGMTTALVAIFNLLSKVKGPASTGS